jgi:hypothetical protein
MPTYSLTNVTQDLFQAFLLIFQECAQEFVESKPGSSGQCRCTFKFPETTHWAVSNVPSPSTRCDCAMNLADGRTRILGRVF